MAPREHSLFISYTNAHWPGRRSRESILNEPGLGMNASTLERIRFAAANRLCVDVGYGGDVQRVEPYSLRKARGGNVVLYACEAGSSECATYRTGGISEVEVTRQTFVPKYANELLSPDR